MSRLDRDSREEGIILGMKTHFVQSFGSYHNTFLVVVGHEGKEILDIAKELSFSDDAERDVGWNKFISENEKDILQTHKEDVCGKVWTCDEWGFGIMYLGGWSMKLTDRLTLMHELHHAVHFMLGEFRSMEKEAEALAYQQEHLYSEIERRLEELRLAAAA